MRYLALMIAVAVATPLIVSADDSAVQLTFTGYCSHPAWSPNGSQIAYGHGDTIWVIPAAGGSATQVTPDPPDPSYWYDSPCWSPDGNQIAFVQVHHDVVFDMLDWDIAVISASGGTPWLISLGLDGHTRDPSWNGGQIAFTRVFFVNDVWVAAETGGLPTQITTGGGENPSWSPDGSMIAFERQILLWSDIWVVPASGGVSMPLGCGGQDPAWSPDGSQVAFAKETDGNWDIWTRPATLSFPAPLTRITSDPAADIQPCWSPDGSQIAFCSYRSGSEKIWVIDVPGPIALDRESWGSIKGKYRE